MEALKEELRRLIPQVVEQIRENTRLRILIWIIAFIVASYPLLLLADYNSALLAELDSQLEKEAKIIRTASEKQWFERATYLEGLGKDVSKKFGIAESLGTAKAAVYQELSMWAEKNALPEHQIKLEEPVLVDKENDIYRLSGQINASFEMEPSLMFLHQLESNEKKYVVERIEISQRTRPIFKLVVATYFTLSNV